MTPAHSSSAGEEWDSGMGMGHWGCRGYRGYWGWAGSGRKTGLAFTQSDDLDKQDMSCHAKETEEKSCKTLKEGRTKRAETASQVLKEKPLKVVIITQDKARRLGKAAILIPRRSHWLFPHSRTIRTSRSRENEWPAIYLQLGFMCFMEPFN